MGSRMNRSGGGLGRAVLIAGAVAVAMCMLMLAALGGLAGAGTLDGACGPTQTVGATEYGGPGDPSSGTVGASGVNLLAQPDSYAELGGTSFQTATALGGLPYGTPLEISAGRRSVIAYKEDIGLGGGPIDGHPREIDLWWQLASSLGIPYEHGRWAGTVHVQLLASECAATGDMAGAAATPLTPGQRATLLPGGEAAGPA